MTFFFKERNKKTTQVALLSTLGKKQEARLFATTIQVRDNGSLNQGGNMWKHKKTDYTCIFKIQSTEYGV